MAADAGVAAPGDPVAAGAPMAPEAPVTSGATVAVGRVGAMPAQRAQNRRQEHVFFRVFWDEQILCRPPWGFVNPAFFQKGRQNHMFAGIDATPPVKRETQHKTYTLHPSRERQRRRSIYGPASTRNVWSEERFLLSQI